MEKIRGVLSGLRRNIASVLTDEQKTQFQQKLQELRQNMPGGQRGGLVQRLHNAIQQLDLTQDQKSQIKQVFEDARDKFQQIREEADGDMQQVRQQGRQLAQDIRTKLQSILTPQQQQKLQDLLKQDRGPTTQGVPPNPKAGGPASGRREAPRNPGPSSSLENESNAPAVGQRLPDLKIRKLDGSSVQLSSYRGHVLVLEFGSYSSPSFRSRVPAMEQLHHDLGSLATFLVIYTQEAHPAGAHEIDRNKDAGISLEQPGDLEARRMLAEKARTALKITIPMLVDDMDNSATTTLGGRENALLVIGRDGRIVARQNWADPSGARRLIEEAIHSNSSIGSTP